MWVETPEIWWNFFWRNMSYNSRNAMHLTFCARVLPNRAAHPLLRVNIRVPQRCETYWWWYSAERPSITCQSTACVFESYWHLLHSCRLESAPLKLLSESHMLSISDNHRFQKHKLVSLYLVYNFNFWLRKQGKKCNSEPAISHHK